MKDRDREREREREREKQRMSEIAIYHQSEMKPVLRESCFGQSDQTLVWATLKPFKLNDFSSCLFTQPSFPVFLYLYGISFISLFIIVSLSVSANVFVSFSIFHSFIHSFCSFPAIILIACCITTY